MRPDRLAQPVEEAAWPLDACDIGRVGGITGVRWLVDIRDDEVLAVTPVWGAVTCFTDI